MKINKSILKYKIFDNNFELNFTNHDFSKTRK